MVDENCCYVTIVTFHDSKVSKLKWKGNVQLFDGHVATIKVIVIEINVNCFLVNKISKTISSHLKWSWRFNYYEVAKYISSSSSCWSTLACDARPKVPTQAPQLTVGGDTRNNSYPVMTNQITQVRKKHVPTFPQGVCRRGVTVD